MTIKIKKGMASLYLVAFTTLLLGILTMSFVEVMLTESKESVNSDLSQSAYDSALAGVEDAKTAILMYNTCRENYGGNNTVDFSFKARCDDIIKYMEKSFDDFRNGGDGSCDTVPKILDINYDNGEVVVGKEDLQQSYTCVTVANEAYDYLTVLGETTPSRTIPVRLRKNQYKEVVAFEVQWYSRENTTSIFGTRGFMANNPAVSSLYTDLYGDGNTYKPFGNKNVATGSLPILTTEIIQTDQQFQMYELDLNNEFNNSGTDHAVVVLYPDPNASKVTYPNGGFITSFINQSTMLAISNKNSTERTKSPQSVFCASNDRDYEYSNFRCRATIEVPPTYLGGERGEQTFMIRVSLPYGAPEDTDVSIRACKKVVDGRCTEYAEWAGNQFVVDSTGRASTLYRRLTVRINAINDVFFYPEYAVQASGKDAAVDKNLWFSKNCWFTDGDGNIKSCANNGSAETTFPQAVPTAD